MKSLNLNRVNLLKLSVLLVFLFPTQGEHYLSGLPINEQFSMLLFLILIFVIKNLDQKLNLILLFLLICFKIFLSTNTNLWQVCVNDALTPTQNVFSYDYFETNCTKSFNNPFSEVTEKKSNISYQINDPEFEWLGANNSNFPLGYLNYSKFNIYELRRDWLPFRMFLTKNVSNIDELEINYIGELEIKYSLEDEYEVFPKSYMRNKQLFLKIPKDVQKIYIQYKFTNWQIPPIPELKSGYPYEKYAKLVIYEKPQFERHKKSLSILPITLFFLFIISKKVLSNKFYIFTLLFVLLLIVNKNTSIFNFEFYSYFGLLIISILFMKKSKDRSLDMILIYLSITFLIIDDPWSSNSFIVKPSGTDALTYENQARLILSGDGMRAGEDIFWYSPGYRYFLYLIHLFFGDGWLNSWQFMLSITVLLILRLHNKFIISAFLFSIFLLMDNVRNLYLYGMSEVLALIFLLFGIYLFESKNKNLIPTVFFSFAVLIRPEIILFVIFYLITNRFSLRSKVLFLSFQFLPLIHNLFYGNSFVLYSSSATYGRNINYDMVKNFEYIIFNPFNEKILITLGQQTIILGFTIVLLSTVKFFINLLRKTENKILENNFYIGGLLCLLPYLIYDPKLFYPRHVLIGLCLLSVNRLGFSILNKKLPE